MSTNRKPRSLEPLRASLSDTDDRIRIDHWATPQQGFFPHPDRAKLFNTLWALQIGV